MADPHANVRAAVEGADRAFAVIDGGRSRGGGDPPPPTSRGESSPCPITALGHAAGVFHFLDIGGQKRELSARQLGARHDLLSLFHGDDAWLRREFPMRKPVKVPDGDGGEVTEERVVDFRLNAAAAYLQRICGGAGLFGPHVQMRAPGVWRGDSGIPIVHRGDQVLVAGEWQRAGIRIGDQVWSAAPAERRPALPCTAQEVVNLQVRMQELWSFKRAGGAIVALGFVAIAYYGSAAAWRPNGFLTGGAGSGKSMLLRVLAELCPIRFETNDTRKAGIEQHLQSRACPCFLDEASDRVDHTAAMGLVDLVLSASGGEGTKGTRGTVDGRGRTFEIAGSFLLASVSPPDLAPQHLARIALIELEKPLEGADNTEAHKALQLHARALAPAMWGRALGGYERFGRALAQFREQLRLARCLPREMDQFGALLAGWWVLAREGDPGPRGALEGVGALSEFLRTADEVNSEDAPRLVIQHLVSARVALHRSTDRDQIGKLIDIALRTRASGSVIDYAEGRNPESAAELLASYGIRVIRRDEPPDKRGRPAMRAADGDGIWIAVKQAAIGELFRGTRWEGLRWFYEVKRLESAVDMPKVRIGAYSGRAVWLSYHDIYPEDDTETEY